MMAGIEYYTPKEVADICGVSIGTIYRWIKIGKLPIETFGSHYKKYISEIDIPLFMRKKIDKQFDDFYLKKGKE